MRIATSLEDHALEAVATATLALAYWGAGQLRRAVEAGKRAIPLGAPVYPSPFGMVMPPAI